MFLCAAYFAVFSSPDWRKTRLQYGSRNAAMFSPPFGGCAHTPRSFGYFAKAQYAKRHFCVLCDAPNTFEQKRQNKLQIMELSFLFEMKRPPMNRRQSEPFHCVAMRGCRVTDVLGKTVIGIAFVVFAHERIAMDFG